MKNLKIQPNNIAVLYITFSRPEYAKKSFAAIKQSKPQKLYFYSNKARENNLEEIERNNCVRNLINEIDWDCDLKTYFRESYVDVYTSLFSAIDWVFQNEQKAIIVEEDCVASNAFFDFCKQMLDLYENDKRIWLISGDNFFEKEFMLNTDYIFSRTSAIYGWASWKDRWLQLDREMKDWDVFKNEKVLFKYFRNKSMTQFHLKRLTNFKSNIKNAPAWDYLFGYTIIKNNGLRITPKYNLVSNIGEAGVHNKIKTVINKIIYNKSILKDNFYFIKNSPSFIYPNDEYDLFYHRNLWLK